MKEQSGFLTRQNILVSVLVFVLCSLAFFATVEQLALLLLQGLDGKKERKVKSQHANTQTRTGELQNDATTEPLTSNSSQKPCLTLSVASASLLSSRTRLSISAALIRVVFRGWGGEQESARKLQSGNAALAHGKK